MLSTVSLIDPTTLNPSFSGPDTSRMGRPAVIITRQDQQASVDMFQLLLTNAKAYRLQMLALSKAAANFGYSLEKIAHSKAAVRDPSNVCSSLQAAAGLHYLMSNHHQILSDTLYKQFEIPLLQHLDTHKSNIEASEAQYERSMRDMSQKIKETEATSMQNGRKRQRDLLQFRQALTTLTMQVDELERIKLGYYFGNLESEQANLQLILQKTSTIVRAEVDIYERIANKGLNDLILEPMTTQGPDPYNSYPTTDEFSSIFSILPPTPIIPTSGAGGTGASTPQQPESIMSNFYGYHEANPFSTARNQTNAASRDRHLFGESSSAESKASMINKAAAASVVTATVTVNGTHPSSTNAAVTDKTKTVKDTPATDATAEVAAQVQKALTDIENKDDSVKQQQQQQDQKKQPAGTAKESTSYSPQPKKATMGLEIQGLDGEVTEEAKSKLKGPEESAEGQETQNPEAGAVVETETDNQVTKKSLPALSSSSSSSQGVDLQSGHQFHRQQNLSKHTNDPSHSASSPSEQSSSVQSYTLGSRSGLKSHLMLSSTPDSPPVRGMIHISQDSDLLNNSDFTFSYDPAELLNQRVHHLSRQAFAGFDALEEEEGGFGATPSSTRQPSETLRDNSGRDTLRHSSSDGQLSHSSSNLSSFASSIGGTLSHRRSTGRMKTDLESSTSAVVFGTSVEEPFLTSMKQQVGVADHIRELGRGLDDGMPAFFADEIDEMEDSLVAGRPTQQTHGFAIGHNSRRGSGSGSDQSNRGSMEKRLRDSNHSLDSILMADGSSKNVSTTQVNEIAT